VTSFGSSGGTLEVGNWDSREFARATDRAPDARVSGAAE